MLLVALGDNSGFDVAQRLTQDNRAGGVRVILTSTRAELALGDVAAECPARCFLPKSDVSAQAIRQVLGSPS